MAPNRISLRKFIRFQLEQLGAENQAHGFEELAFELARSRVASNVVRATGPVQAGGDQGRDFETFRTYLGTSAIAGSAFVARASGDIIAFACTLNKRIEAKIRADLATIFGGGARPTRIAYFCVPDVAVARRHELQSHCRELYGVEVDLFDGQAVSDMLCDGDTFWIAEHFLSVPSEMFPPVTVDAEYEELKGRWLGKKERGPTNLAEFLEIKRGLRRATFEENARPDLAGWMSGMALVKAIPQLRRKAIYELAVASLRGRGILDADEHSLADYFDTLGDDPELEDIEDIAYLASYVSSAARMGHLRNGGEHVAQWVAIAAAAVKSALGSPGSDYRKFRLLRVHGQVTMFGFWHAGSKKALLQALAMWSEAADIAASDPLSDPASLGELLLLLAPAAGALEAYQTLTDKVDGLIAKREGAAAAGEQARDRAIAFARADQLLLAIDQLQRAKENWFNAETLRGSVMAMLLLSSWYGQLKLPHAARYHASMALYVLVRAREENLGDLSVRAGFALADSFYCDGEMLSYLACIENVMPVHANFRIDPDDAERHEDLIRAILHGGVILATAHALAPQLVPRAHAIIDGWMIDDAYRDAMRDAAKSPPWSETAPEQMVAKLAAELGQDIVNDVRDPLTITWSALGIEWTVIAHKRLRVRADALVAMLQIVQADLGGVDLVVIPSAVEIGLEVGGDDWARRQEPDNGKLVWTVSVPDRDPATSDAAQVERDAGFGLAFVMEAMRKVSALPQADFLKIFETRMERGLWKKVFFVRPPEHLMAEARAMADFERDAGPLTVAGVRPHYAPLAAPELAGSTGDAVLYSTEKAEEFIANRYRRLGPFAARVVPALMADTRTASLLTEQHAAGVKDWELVIILFNIALNRLVQADPQKMTAAGFGDYQRRMAEGGETILAGMAPPFDTAWLTAEDLPMQILVGTGTIAQTWGLEVRRQTPDFDAIRRLLVARFRHLEDDVAHDDWFGWSLGA